MIERKESASEGDKSGGGAVIVDLELPAPTLEARSVPGLSLNSNGNISPSLFPPFTPCHPPVPSTYSNIFLTSLIPSNTPLLEPKMRPRRFRGCQSETGAKDDFVETRDGGYGESGKLSPSK